MVKIQQKVKTQTYARSCPTTIQRTCVKRTDNKNNYHQINQWDSNASAPILSGSLKDTYTKNHRNNNAARTDTFSIHTSWNQRDSYQRLNPTGRRSSWGTLLHVPNGSLYKFPNRIAERGGEAGDAGAIDQSRLTILAHEREMRSNEHFTCWKSFTKKYFFVT